MTSLHQRFSEPSRPIRSAAPAAPLRRTLVLTALALVFSTVLTGSIARPNRESFSGTLCADKAIVTAPVDGTIQTLDVTPGQIVVPGHALFTISDPSLESKRSVLQSEVLRLQAELSSAKASAEVKTAELMDDIDAQIFATENLLAEHLAERYLEQFKAKAWGDFGSLMHALASTELPKTDLRPLIRELPDPVREIEAMIKQADAENRSETMQARIAIAETRLKSLRERRAGLPKQFALAARIPQIERSLSDVQAELAILNSRETEESIKAPVYGIAGNVERTLHSEVKAGDILLELFDRDNEYVLASLPARFGASLKPGATVQLHFPGDEMRSGHVEAIPPQTTSGAARENEATILVRILPRGKVWPYLPVGSTVHVSLE